MSKILAIDLADPDPDVVMEIARVVRAGGVIVSPTDTIYGLGCDPFQPVSVERVLALKRRDPNRGFLVLLDQPETATRLARIPHDFEALTAAVWPGPVTLLLEALPGLPAELQGQGGKIGLRIPRSAFLLQLLQAMNGPLLSTSANLSGEPTPSSFEKIRELWDQQVDLLVGTATPTDSSASTVVDLTGPQFEILRRGSNCERVEQQLRRLANRKR